MYTFNFLFGFLSVSSQRDVVQLLIYLCTSMFIYTVLVLNFFMQVPICILKIVLCEINQMAESKMR